MTEYLAFVDEIGRSVDGKYIYRFDFTTDTEVVWGDFFNVTPSGIIPKLEPDINTISKSAKIIFPRKMSIAKESNCFSMQDCIDGIIPLIYSDIDEDTLEFDNAPFFLPFGIDKDEVDKKISGLGLKFFDLEEVEHGSDSAIDKLIDSMGDNNDDDNFEDDGDDW